MKTVSKAFLLTLLLSGFLLAGLRIDLKAQETDLRDADAEAMQGDRIRGQVGDLDHLSSKQREELLDLVNSESRKTQAVLVSRLDSDQKEVKFCAAYLLGYYRFEGAVPPLVENLTLEDNTPRKALWHWIRYPAAEALIRIGGASVPPMIEKLETSQNSKERDVALMVVRSVEGLDVARFVLQQAMKKQEDPQHKARLQTAVTNLEALEKAGF